VGGLARRLVVISLVAGASCATPPGWTRPEEIVRRGVILVRKGWSVSALARGPALVHVYSESAGGLVYIAAAGSDGAEGCDKSGASLAQAPLEPERRLTVAIRDGEVVCLATQSSRTLEVLWHAHRVSPIAPEYRLRPATLAAKP
jgi:hypothetical protein